VFLPQGPGVLALLTPIYEALVRYGGIVEHQYVRFGSWPLQILTDATELEAEAIRDAATVAFDGVATRVFRAEHLCAVALQTGREKDYLRVKMFLDQNAVDRDKLADVVERYGLSDRLARATV